MYKVTTAWDQARVKWRTPWKKAGGDYESKEIAKCTNGKAAVWEEYDVTQAIQGFIAEPSTNLGFILSFRLDDYGCQYPSSESTKDEKLRPKLTLITEATAIDQTAPSPMKSKYGWRQSATHISFSIPYSQYNVSIFDAQGKLKLSYKGTNGYNWFDLGNFSSGIHLMIIDHNNLSEESKFMVIK